jgi:hypothetical protein
VHVDARLVAADERLPAAHIVVANISEEAVRALPPRIDARVVVTSGYLASSTIDLDGYSCVERRVREGWAADVHRRV